MKPFLCWPPVFYVLGGRISKLSFAVFQEPEERGSNKIMTRGQGMEEEQQEKQSQVSGVDEKGI